MVPQPGKAFHVHPGLPWHANGTSGSQTASVSALAGSHAVASGSAVIQTQPVVVAGSHAAGSAASATPLRSAVHCDALSGVAGSHSSVTPCTQLQPGWLLHSGAASAAQKLDVSGEAGSQLAAVSGVVSHAQPVLGDGSQCVGSAPAGSPTRRAAHSAALSGSAMPASHIATSGSHAAAAMHAASGSAAQSTCCSCRWRLASVAAPLSMLCSSAFSLWR